MYWAEALAAQTKDQGLQAIFALLQKKKRTKQQLILNDWNARKTSRNWWLLPTLN
jgi:monomeric isocitrate dehydrogenase